MVIVGKTYIQEESTGFLVTMPLEPTCSTCWAIGVISVNMASRITTGVSWTTEIAASVCYTASNTGGNMTRLTVLEDSNCLCRCGNGRCGSQAGEGGNEGDDGELHFGGGCCDFNVSSTVAS